MNDYEKFVSILTSAGTDYFGYSDYDSYSNRTDFVTIFQDGVAIIFRFITYEDRERLEDKQNFAGFEIAKSYKDLSEFVSEVVE